jgi:type I restriction enzyme S subunit
MTKEDFKETEIGKIPSDWEVKKLEEVSTKITKGTTPTTLKRNFVDKGINFIKVESLTESGDFIPSKFAYIDEETNELLKRSIIQENDILFSIAGVIGRTSIATKNILPANTNQAISIIRPDFNKIKPLFLRYSLSNKRFLYSVQSDIVQTAQPNLSLGLLGKSFISLPPIQEQEKIANILSKLDEKIELNNKICKSIESVGQALFK